MQKILLVEMWCGEASLGYLCPISPGMKALIVNISATWTRRIPGKVSKAELETFWAPSPCLSLLLMSTLILGDITKWQISELILLNFQRFDGCSKHFYASSGQGQGHKMHSVQYHQQNQIIKYLANIHNTKHFAGFHLHARSVQDFGGKSLSENVPAWQYGICS